MDSEERIRHDALFYSLQPEDKLLLSGGRARAIFIKSKLNLQELSKIWKLADSTRDNMLDEREFAIAIHLIQKRLCGLEIPASLPATLNLDPWSLIDIQKMTTVEKQAYEALFSISDVENQGFLKSDKVRDLFTLSNLPMPVLAKIWDIADIDRDGKISKEEFCIAIHLLRFCQQSGSTLHGTLDSMSLLPTESCQESLEDKRRRLAEIQTEKRKLMSLRRKLRSEMETAEVDKTEAAILKIQSDLDSTQRDLDNIDSLEASLRKEVMNTVDDASAVSRKELLAFDRSFLMRKKITGSDIFNKQSPKRGDSGIWDTVPKDIFLGDKIKEYYQQLKKRGLVKTPRESTSPLTKNQKSRGIKIGVSSRYRMETENSERPEALSEEVADISSQLEPTAIAKEARQATDKYNLATDNKLENRDLVSNSTSRRRDEEECFFYDPKRADIFKISSTNSEIAVESEKHLVVQSRGISQCDQTNDIKSEDAVDKSKPRSTSQELNSTTKEGRQNEVSDSVLVDFSSSTASNETPSLSSNTSSENGDELVNRRTSLSRKRELWLQQQQTPEALSAVVTTEEISSSIQPTVYESTFNGTSEKAKDLEEIDELKYANYTEVENKEKTEEKDLRHDKAIDMDLSKVSARIVEDEIYTSHEIQHQRAQDDWFDKVRCLDSLLDSQPSTSEQSESDGGITSPSPLRKAKSEHDILSRNDEKRGSKRRKVLKTKSGQIVRRQLPGLTSIENPEKQTFVKESSWLEGLVKTEIEVQEERRASLTKQSHNIAQNLESEENHSQNKEGEMYYDPRMNTLPRSETIDEESIRINDRREWLGRLLEMEIQGRQETLKKLQKQKSMQVSSGNSSGNERRRSLPAGRLVEEYLHRQAVDIAPAYEQPGDFARLSQPKGNAYRHSSAVHRVKSSPTPNDGIAVNNIGYNSNSYMQGEMDDQCHFVDSQETDEVFTTSGIVRNNAFVTGTISNENKQTPVAQTTSMSPLKKTGPNSVMKNTRNEHSIQSTHIQHKSEKACNGMGRTKALELQHQQHRSLDSSLYYTQMEGEEIDVSKERTQSVPPKMETKSTSVIDQDQNIQKVGLPSVKDKIAAFRNAETTSSPELSQKPFIQEQTWNSPLRTSKSLDYKNAETVKNLEVVLSDPSFNQSESRPGKFHIHQNNTVVRRALDIASSDSLEKNDNLHRQQRIDTSKDDVSDISQEGTSDEPTTVFNMARSSKKFWESMSHSNGNGDEPGAVLNKGSGDMTTGIDDKKFYGRPTELDLAQDIGAAILGYDESTSSYGTDNATPSDTSFPVTDSESDDDDNLEYLRLVQDDRIKREIEEQNLRDKEMRRMNKGRQKLSQSMVSDYSNVTEKADPRSSRATPSPNVLQKEPLSINNTRDDYERNIATSPRYGQRQMSFPKQFNNKVQDNYQVKTQASTGKPVDSIERPQSGMGRSKLLQKEEEEERRRQMEFEEEKRQRMEEARKREEQELENQRQMEIKRLKQEEAEAERQRLMQEKKLEGKRKTHSLRALFEKVY